MRILISFILCLAILGGCNQPEKNNAGDFAERIETHNPTAEETLAQNPDADIFELNGVVYSNASDIEWVQTTELTTGKNIGTITKQYKDGLVFEDQMATKLPIGTEIYEPLKGSGPILIVKLNGKEIRYLGLIEG
ncbi:hypothetical protein [Ammoniphilus resinae]|uniref:Lipoprotein n=1 Tax=Ammoniphilus resinae TaxID=861532 RepID=A0ABS4GT35_9BACL|nr:hypothetical protein [Ammoniphilus resinae]MBP1933187.1 hypothetical protein [Ammoniphilus resinae]